MGLDEEEMLVCRAAFNDRYRGVIGAWRLELWSVWLAAWTTALEWEQSLPDGARAMA